MFLRCFCVLPLNYKAVEVRPLLVSSFSYTFVFIGLYCASRGTRTTCDAKGGLCVYSYPFTWYNFLARLATSSHRFGRVRTFRRPFVYWLNAGAPRYRRFKGPACLLALSFLHGVEFGYFIGWPFRLAASTYSVFVRYPCSVPFPHCHCKKLFFSLSMNARPFGLNSFALFTSKAFGGCLCRCKARTSALCLHVVFIAFGLPASL